MTDTSFCTKCGMRVSEEALYCPACGAPIEGRVDQSTGMSAQQAMENQIVSSRMNFITMLLLIYGLPIVIIGICAVISAGHVTSILIVDDMVQEAMAQYSLTEADIKSAITYGGAIFAVSGGLALLSAICVHKRRYWIVAVLGAGAASILCTMSIFGVFIGLMVTWMIVDMKSQFDVDKTDRTI